MNPLTPVETFQLARDVQGYLFAIWVVGSLFLGFNATRKPWRPFLVTCVCNVFLVVILWVLVDVSGHQPGTLIRQGARIIPPDIGTGIMLIADLAIVTGLVWITGGSERSCYSPLYFMLPTFTLLLWDYGQFLLWYSVAAVVAFASTLFGNHAVVFFKPVLTEAEEHQLVSASRWMLLLISAFCLGLAIYIDVKRTASPEPTGSIAKVFQISPTVPPEPQPTAVPTATPTRRSLDPTSPAPAPNRLDPAQSLTTYSEFLNSLQDEGKKEREPTKILKRHIGERISWQVRFQRSERVRNEIRVFFSEIDPNYSARERPVRFAKSDQKKLINSLSKGEAIQMDGHLRRHSSQELFVEASAIKRLGKSITHRPGRKKS